MSASYPKLMLTMEAIATKDRYLWHKYHPLPTRTKQLQLTKQLPFKKNHSKKPKSKVKIKTKHKLKVKVKSKQQQKHK